MRVTPSPAAARVAQMVAAGGGGQDLDVAFVRHCLSCLDGAGFSEVITAAIGPHEQAPYLDAGFEHREALHLLAHDLASLPTVAPEHALRRVRRRDWPAVVGLDERAFRRLHHASGHASGQLGTWQLDARGIAEACRATPSGRMRVAMAGGSVVGYAVTGRSGDRGYLQRLAVDPGAQGRGRGRALVVDGLAWMARRGVARALVNTQVTNERALGLYLSLGFTLLPHGLAVLSHALRPGR